MKKTVNRYDFHRAFEQLRPDNFTHDGLGVLYDWFEEYEDSIGEEVELDVIAICCDWSESTVEEIVGNYQPYIGEGTSVIDWLNNQTMVAGVTGSGSIVYMGF